jgi:hypothetical protein
MPIPELVDNVLPEGVHDCTIEEITAAFGRFQRSDRRIELTGKLRAYLIEAKRVGILSVYVDGSYVTALDEPQDIDLIVILPSSWDFTRDLKPFEYNTVTKAGVKRVKLPFDLFVYADGADEIGRMVAFFSQTNRVKYPDLTSRDHKGLLRVVL